MGLTEREYIKSFGWEPEDLTEDKLKQARKELKEIESGKIILDGVLAFKIVPLYASVWPYCNSI